MSDEESPDLVQIMSTVEKARYRSESRIRHLQRVLALAKEESEIYKHLSGARSDIASLHIQAMTTVHRSLVKGVDVGSIIESLESYLSTAKKLPGLDSNQ